MIVLRFVIFEWNNYELLSLTTRKAFSFLWIFLTISDVNHGGNRRLLTVFSGTLWIKMLWKSPFKIVIEEFTTVCSKTSDQSTDEIKKKNLNLPKYSLVRDDDGLNIYHKSCCIHQIIHFKFPRRYILFMLISSPIIKYQYHRVLHSLHSVYLLIE